MSLKTDYKDAIPAAGAGTARRYKMVDNGDGTVSFQDVTTYSQVGDKAQASVFNGIGTEVNGKVDSATINGAAVPKSGATLQLPAYPVIPGSLPANGGTSTYAHYPSHAVGLADFGLRGNYMSSASPSGGNDGDTWDQV